jgi:hypothetical protein
VLVVRSDTCPLCEEALKVLRGESMKLGLRIREHSISEDPELLSIYGNHIPVVYLEGRLRFFGHIDLALLRREVSALRRV